ncbi:unnamed protein product [Cylindrotheca closterium]|uniref:Uncharacterized protein n=1 Tax=Cylindrotheca closterium TaxID=2856 RepID=A0AAD2FEX3_9STRA|nr:unnamed protein product [Cylindrotheca closterium]
MPGGESTRRSRRTNLGQPPRRLGEEEETLEQDSNRTVRFRDDNLEEIIDNRTAQVEMNQGQGAQQGGSNSLTEELLYNALVLAYDSVDQDQFKAFMGVKDNSAIQPHEDLMSEADAKFLDLDEKKVWNVPSQSQQIMSLTTLISKAEKKTIDVQRQLDKSKQSRKEKSKRKPSPADEAADSGKRQRQTDFDRWMVTKPKKGEETKVVQKKGPNGQVKGWNWCDKHKKMVLAIGRDGRPHNSDTCALSKTQSNSNPKRAKKQLRVNALKAALALEDDSASDNATSNSDDTGEFPTNDDGSNENDSDNDS